LKAPNAGARDRKPDPYGFEAKEYLRKRTIGKEIKVLLEYEKKFTPQK